MACCPALAARLRLAIMAARARGRGPAARVRPGGEGGVGDTLEALDDGGLDLPTVVAPRALQCSGDGKLVVGGVAKFATCASPLCHTGRRRSPEGGGQVVLDADGGLRVRPERRRED
eukprot:5524120-Pyramimonas_sp.AAC.1